MSGRKPLKSQNQHELPARRGLRSSTRRMDSQRLELRCDVRLKRRSYQSISCRSSRVSRSNRSASLVAPLLSLSVTASLPCFDTLLRIVCPVQMVHALTSGRCNNLSFAAV